jgi:benzoyl-CoA 2,3-dioxygenase component A
VTDNAILDQHLIDPEVCIRCNTCESVCPVQAITHDHRNYVVDPAKCNKCMACIAPCPTGSIDHWRRVPVARAYSTAAQLEWETLPAELPAEEIGDAVSPEIPPPSNTTGNGAIVPPWSAAKPRTNLFGPRAAQASATATVAGNVRVTAIGRDYDTHHIVLDFGATQFPVLEGQSIGIIPPGVDAAGRAHHPRQYSIASARNGERPGYNNLSLTIKRVLADRDGNPVRGVASNFMCDLRIGDKVAVTGPFGASFLMPNHPGSHIVMICTGTGSAPMRAMTEWRRRQRRSGAFTDSRLMLFFGARSEDELPYFGPLQTLPRDFIDITFAFSRMPGMTKRYVQDALRDRAGEVAALLADPNAFFYVCGLRSMEEGVIAALRDIAVGAGFDWSVTMAALKNNGRLHLETY